MVFFKVFAGRYIKCSGKAPIINLSAGLKLDKLIFKYSPIFCSLNFKTFSDNSLGKSSTVDKFKIL